MELGAANVGDAKAMIQVTKWGMYLGSLSCFLAAPEYTKEWISSGYSTGKIPPLYARSKGLTPCPPKTSKI
jgi:hypothetical protein